MKKFEKGLLFLMVFTFICTAALCTAIVYTKNKSNNNANDNTEKQQEVTQNEDNKNNNLEVDDKKQYADKETINNEQEKKDDNILQSDKENNKTDDNKTQQDNENNNAEDNKAQQDNENNNAEDNKNQPDNKNHSNNENSDADNIKDQTNKENNDLDDKTPAATGKPNIEEDKNQQIYKDIKVCLMGDLMCLAGQQYSALKPDGSYDFSDSFVFIKEYLADKEIIVGNLETLIAESIPTSSEQKVVNDAPNCNGPKEYLKSLKELGFDGFATANNHCLDGHITGVNETIANLDEYSFEHCGTYAENSNNNHYIIFDTKEIKVGIISLTELINQRYCVSKSVLEKTVDCYSKEYAKQLIDEVRAAGAEFVIVYIHWGSENVTEINNAQKKAALELAEAGADFIAGSHSHCVQSFSMITCEDGREVPCIYSLGNFISSMTREINNDSIIFELTLTKDENGVRLSNLAYLPCHVLGGFMGYVNVIVPTAYVTNKSNPKNQLKEAADRIAEVLYNVETVSYIEQ